MLRVIAALARSFVMVSGALVCAPDLSFGQQPTYGIASLSLTPRDADKSAELGADMVRVVYGWDVIEGACKGCFDWTVPDAWRDEARRTNRRIYALIAYAPRWANGDQHYSHPPLRPQDWYDFVFAAVKRYENDVFYWGIWNEPNLTAYLSDGDVRTYGTLVSTARAAIRAANPQALVLGPEVSWHAVRSSWFASAMHAYGDLFDIITVHWYLDGPQLEFMMDQLVRPFANGKAVWLSETGKNPCGAFGEVGQAWLYQRVLDAMQPRRAWWTGVVFYVLSEPSSATDCGSGITREDGSNRPAFSIYQAFIRSHP